MLPILSCTCRRFGHRTEETSLCPVWDSGAAKGSLAHQFKGLLEFVLSYGGESWQVPCRASGDCLRSLCRGDCRGAPTSPPAFAPRCTALVLALVMVDKCEPTLFLPADLPLHLSILSPTLITHTAPWKFRHHETSVVPGKVLWCRSNSGCNCS